LDRRDYLSGFTNPLLTVVGYFSPLFMCENVMQLKHVNNTPVKSLNISQPHKHPSRMTEISVVMEKNTFLLKV
jgi:hypothetical protein